MPFSYVSALNAPVFCLVEACSLPHPGVEPFRAQETEDTKLGEITYYQGPVVQKPVNANLGLKVNQGFFFSC